MSKRINSYQAVAAFVRGFEIFRSRIDEAETLDDLNAVGASLKSARLSPEEKTQLREAWSLKRDAIRNSDVEDANINQ